MNVLDTEFGFSTEYMVTMSRTANAVQNVWRLERLVFRLDLYQLRLQFALTGSPYCFYRNNQETHKTTATKALERLDSSSYNDNPGAGLDSTESQHWVEVRAPSVCA